MSSTEPTTRDPMKLYMSFLLVFLLGGVLGWFLGRLDPIGPDRVPPGPKVMAISHLNGVVTVEVEFEPVDKSGFKPIITNCILVGREGSAMMVPLPVTPADIEKLNGKDTDKAIKRKVTLELKPALPWTFIKDDSVATKPCLLFGKSDELGSFVGDPVVLKHG